MRSVSAVRHVNPGSRTCTVPVELHQNLLALTTITYSASVSDLFFDCSPNSIVSPFSAAEYYRLHYVREFLVHDLHHGVRLQFPGMASGERIEKQETRRRQTRMPGRENPWKAARSCRGADRPYYSVRSLCFLMNSSISSDASPFSIACVSLSRYSMPSSASFSS